MMDLISLLGYSKNSPFRGNPYLDIHTPEGLIDMSNTPIDLIGIDNKGNKKKMKAGAKAPYKFEGDIVREIPMQDGGQAKMREYLQSLKSKDKQTITPKYVAKNTREAVDARREQLWKQQWEAEKAQEQQVKKERENAKITRNNPNHPFTFPDGTSKKWKDMDWREKTYVAGRNLANMQNDNFTDLINPAAWLGSMSEGLGVAPYLYKKEDSIMPYLTGAGVPLLTGLLAGTGAKNTKQFLNNLGNPFAGTGEFLTTKTPLKNTYKINPWAFKPQEGMMYRGVGEPAITDAIESGLIRQNPNGSYSGTDLFVSPNYNIANMYSTAAKLGDKNVKKALIEIPKDAADFVQHDKLGFHFRTSDAIPTSKAKLYKEDWLKGYKEVPKPKSTQSITRGPIDYSQEPGFRSRNPNFNHEAYVNSVDKFGNTSSHELPEHLKPKLITTSPKKEQKGGNPYQMGGITQQQLYDFLFEGDDEEQMNEQETQSEINNESNQRVQLRQMQFQKQMVEEQELNNMAMNEATSYVDVTSNMSPNMSYSPQTIGSRGKEIYNDISSFLGYSPIPNSAYRTKAKNDELVKKGLAVPNSFHLTGDAFDFKPEDWGKLSPEQKSYMKSKYDVIYHNNHYHVEPKTK